ncbi:MAG TPA: YqgE/AlgH family protein [Actinomycetota bacterium]|nr:YqgE/AlgH family protein [Actinomycetota bacterium]
MESLRGQLLVAGPALWDPNFRRSVVLIGHHDDEGAVGVVLNRASEVSVLDAAPSLSELAGPGAMLFLGGPVQTEAAVVVADFAQPERAGLLALGSIGFLVGEDPDAAGGIQRARVFAGYAGWGPGQLEAELEEESWIVEPALPSDVFTDRPALLWADVLRRKGSAYEIIALMPEDPSLN